MSTFVIRNARDLATLARSTRLARGLTQEDVARRVGVSRVWLGAVERGKPTAQIDLVLRLLRVLDIELRADPRPAEADPLRAVVERLRD